MFRGYTRNAGKLEASARTILGLRKQGSNRGLLQLHRFFLSYEQETMCGESAGVFPSFRITLKHSKWTSQYR
jgi:hypothetical protein